MSLKQKIKDWFKAKNEQFPAQITITQQEMEDGQITPEEWEERYFFDWELEQIEEETPKDPFSDQEIQLDFSEQNPNVEPPELEL